MNNREIGEGRNPQEARKPTTFKKASTQMSAISEGYRKKKEPFRTVADNAKSKDANGECMYCLARGSPTSRRKAQAMDRDDIRGGGVQETQSQESEKTRQAENPHLSVTLGGTRTASSTGCRQKGGAQAIPSKMAAPTTAHKNPADPYPTAWKWEMERYVLLTPLIALPPLKTDLLPMEALLQT
ncbi:hypothetical protein B296_00049719 [Ensete ventricosum]|uniref:Uncharacterized protein n=1 Tax=Ensete ventricosum TaxID=4639 RepID=A0A426XCS9_ENSVE|nr:hypothetical protein B296_00049719 [Ensete ventricosum]